MSTLWRFRARSAAAVSVGAAVTSLIVLAGCGSAQVAPSRAEVSPARTSSPSATRGPSETASPRPAEPRPIPPRTARVVGLRLPAIGLAANRLEELRLLPDGSLAAPRDPALPGWYGGGPVPGELGPAIIAGHVDSKTGPAVFARLGQLEPGDGVTVAISEVGASQDAPSKREVGFTVDRIVHATKKEFPTEEVYGSTPDAQLRLITCSGPYDRVAGSYTDNTVVFATADGSSRERQGADSQP